MTIKCNHGCVNGIFYFTSDERLEDSQVCGSCNGKGWIEKVE